MSRKKKAMRAFLFQNPDATRVECWDAAWANEQSRVSSLKHQELEAQVADAKSAMQIQSDGYMRLKAENKHLDSMRHAEELKYLKAQSENVNLVVLLRDAVHRIGTEGFDAKWQKAAKAALEISDG